MIKVNKKFVFLIILSFAFALVLGGNLPYAVFYTFVVTLVIELIYMLRIIKSLEISFKWKKNMYTVGENEDLKILIRNYSIPYLYIVNENFKMFNKNYNGHCLFVDSFGSELIQLNLNFNHRGIYDLGKFHVKIYDLFNVFSLKKDFYLENHKVKIYPRIHQIKGEWVFGDGTCDSRNRHRNFTEDTALIKDVRKYVSGDSLKRVHWKLSAKHRQLYVKSFESTSGKFGNVFLNMSKNSFSGEGKDWVEEQCIETTTSLVNYMNNNKIKSKIFISDNKSNKLDIYSTEAFNEFMEAMVIQKSDGDIAFSKFIDMHIKYIPYGGLIYIITPEVHKELWNLMCRLVNKNYRIILLYSLVDDCNYEYIESLDKIGVKTINMKNISHNAKGVEN